MRIAEIFRSLQGEGRLTGTESVFVRTSGCNLRCGYCDTPYASWSPEGDFLPVDEVVARVEELARGKDAARPIMHVVLTGGEPMIVDELVPLSGELHRLGMHITVETAGTRFMKVQCDLMSVSPKLSNSRPGQARDGEGQGEQTQRWIDLHERNRENPEAIRRLNAEYDCQFKFVVETPEDCGEVTAYLEGFPEIDRRRVLLMPQGTTASELAAHESWLQPYCAEKGLTFCPRRQIEWFGLKRGT